MWEEWDTQDYTDAWKSLEAVVQGGGGEEELRSAVNELLGRGWRPVHAAARHGQMSELEMFLDFLDPLVERAELLKDQRGLTALHLAALSGHLDVVKRLLPQGKLRPKARAVCHYVSHATPQAADIYQNAQRLIDDTWNWPSAGRPTSAVLNVLF